MTINSNRYVSINSSVGAGVSVPERELIGRIFVDNPLIPIGASQEFSSASDVGQLFGTSSEEYKRAVQYFSWTSKTQTRPLKISYARWGKVATAPQIFGDKNGVLLTSLIAIANGSFSMTIGADTNTFSAIDLSAAATYADVATILQTAIRTKTGTMWTAATVTYDAVNGRFNFVGGSTTTAAISVANGTTGTTTLMTILGWVDGTTLIWSAGTSGESPVDALENTTNASDNFGSFLFVPTLTDQQVVDVANWNNTQNVMFQFYYPVTSTTYASLSAALIGIGGTGLVLSDSTSDEYQEQAPMQILAATRYDRVNSVQNYMFQQFPTLEALVTSDADANTYDAARVNYIGGTQTAGQYLAFFQQGVLMGGETDLIDMNTYANEQWLKAAAKAALLTLLLALAKVSANAQGRAQVIGTIQGVVNRALLNGTISVDKDLTDIQKAKIEQLTGDENAWYQVQNSGYWLDGVVVPTTVNDIIRYKCVYTLVYSKDDDIRKIEGEHIAI